MARLCGPCTLHNDISLVIVRKYRTQIKAQELYVPRVCSSVFVRLLTSDNMMLSLVRAPIPYSFSRPRPCSKFVARGPHAFARETRLNDSASGTEALCTTRTFHCKRVATTPLLQRVISTCSTRPRCLQQLPKSKRSR
jgi:hypothetical protein